MVDNKIPVIIISFNRPDYLELVLLSLKRQSLPLDLFKIYLFQDGGIDRFSGKVVADTSKSIETFKYIFPTQTIIESDVNLGVALNYDRAEKFAFDVLKADYAFFFEDDLVLGFNYLKALMRMTEFALDEPRVGYVAAYGDHYASPKDQISNAKKVIMLDHKWGFALTKRQWLLQKEIIDGYIDIIKTSNYQSRNHGQIQKYFRSLGFVSPGSSQDAAKDVASCVLGTVKLNCFLPFAKYIGKKGTHFNPEFYDKGKWGESIVYNGDVPDFNFPNKDQIENIYQMFSSASKDGDAQ